MREMRAGVPAGEQGASLNVTDQQRLEVVRELWAMAYREGATDGFRLLSEYERRVKERAQ
jgi:hypothetical protein